ncbi:MAG TPA: hypothetical protein VK971_07300, partial [Thiohalobacter sp.]|nr:hypothetical protein [Thiohalobacter sp.]
MKSSFTGLDTVFAPGSEYVCDGCVACMQEKGDVTLLDGEERSGQKLRAYSWVVTEKAARAATKSHRKTVRGLCLSPPAPPFSIVIGGIGKKMPQRHLLYRGVV